LFKRSSLLADNTTFIPVAAICVANSAPRPDEAPVMTAQDPQNCVCNIFFFFSRYTY